MRLPGAGWVGTCPFYPNKSTFAHRDSRTDSRANCCISSLVYARNTNDSYAGTTANSHREADAAAHSYRGLNPDAAATWDK